MKKLIKEKVTIFISKETKAKIQQIIGNKSTNIITVYSKIFTKDFETKEWVNSTLEGYLCLIQDRQFKCPFLRLYHPVSCQCLFECEMYFNFHESYTKGNDFFYYFPIPQGYIGFAFSTVKQAAIFQKKITIFAKKKEINSKEYKLKKQYGAIIGKAKKYTKIRKPTEFKKVGGYNFNKNVNGLIDIANMNKEQQEMLKNAGVHKSYLKDKEYSDFVLKTVQRVISSNEEDIKEVKQSKRQRQVTSNVLTEILKKELQKNHLNEKILKKFMQIDEDNEKCSSWDEEDIQSD